MDDKSKLYRSMLDNMFCAQQAQNHNLDLSQLTGGVFYQEISPIQPNTWDCLFNAVERKRVASLEDRQKALYEQMRREKRHLYDGHEYVPAANTDVAKHWRKE